MKNSMLHRCNVFLLVGWVVSLALVSSSLAGPAVQIAWDVPLTIPPSAMALVAVDSAQVKSPPHPGASAIDGDPATFWHTKWDPAPAAALPHQIIVTIGRSASVHGLTYLPRQDGLLTGTIGTYEVFVSADGAAWGTAVARGTFPYTAAPKVVTFAPTPAQYVRLVALSEGGGQPYTAVAELTVQYRAGLGTTVAEVAVSADLRITGWQVLRCNAPSGQVTCPPTMDLAGATTVPTVTTYTDAQVTPGQSYCWTAVGLLPEGKRTGPATTVEGQPAICRTISAGPPPPVNLRLVP